ncbi:MAG: hypothetical protein M1819_000934 [Sarea resinae]|nr:MAG: hypothetical protein M1819_000934 [Sarea resinae]
MVSPIEVPVIIIGGGGCGLNLSVFLSNLGVEHYLFERHPGTAILPKAHYLNQRSMEIFRQHGIDDIKAQGCPARNMSQIIWQTSLGGQGPYDRRVIGQLDAFGGAEHSAHAQIYRKDSAVVSSNLPLIRSEPVFRAAAEKRNPGKVLFSHEVTDLVDKGDYVLVSVKDSNDQVVDYHAQYVVAADAGKTAGPRIGVQMEGPTGIVDFVSVHFKADLSKYWDGMIPLISTSAIYLIIEIIDRALITHFINLEGGSMANFDCGALVQMGPTWGKRSEEWTIHFGFDLNDKERFNEAALVPRLRQLLKLPDLELEVLHYSHWVLERVLANKYREGRIFIAGDAAHRRPPTTGLGLNTAIEDALNIAWKLSMVVHGKANPSLLDTYESERRPVGKRNSDWGLFTFSHFNVLNSAIGLIPGQVKANNQRFANIFEDSALGDSIKAQIQRTIELQNIEFSAHDIELGFRYEKGAVTPDGTDPPPADPVGQIYYPTTRPGHRLPHAWLEFKGKVLSTHDLIGRSGNDFLLITDEDGDELVKEAETLAKRFALTIAVARIQRHRHSDGSDLYDDRDGQWARVRELGAGGALLVRPDNFVAWRSRAAGQIEGKSLTDNLTQLLHHGQARLVNGHQMRLKY